jgi:hypothetical protein
LGLAGELRRCSPPATAISCRPPPTGRSHASSAAGSRSNAPDLNPLPRRLRTTRAVGSRSDASRNPPQPRTATAFGSRSNGSRSGQPESTKSTPAGSGVFAEKPLGFPVFADLPYRLWKTLRFSPFYFILAQFLFKPLQFSTCTFFRP